MRQNASAQLDVRALHAAVRSDRLAKQDANEERINRAKQAAVERNVVGEATDALGLRHAKKWRASGANLIEPMQLEVPITRKLPLYSDKGLRSFHLAWQPIAKTLKRRSLANGTMLSPGAAAENVRYIAAAHEQAGEASAHVQYLDGDRVHRDENGDKLFLTNIAPNDLPECVRFFERVEEHEQKPNPDALEVWFDRDIQLWRSVANDPDCDPALAAAWAQWRKQHLDDLARGKVVESAKLDISLFGGADDLEELLERHGRAPLGDKEKADCHQQDGYYLRRGRGGRVQHRVNGSLPAHMPDPQKREVLQRIVERLGGMGGMYLAVLHEPDHANDPDHHHFHIAIYDRPCRRFTNQPSEADRINTRGDKKLVEDDLRSGAFSAYEGEWDFTVRRTYRTSSRNKRVQYPFRQKKAEAFRPYGTIKKFRRFVAETVNAVSIENGGKPIYDPSRYSEMGIDKEADERLQPRAHQREVKGYPTVRGIDNERKQAEACRREVERRYRKELEALEASGRNLELLAGKAGPASSIIILDSRLNLAEQATVIEAAKELALLDLECERELSRAKTVNATAMRRLRALGLKAQKAEWQRVTASQKHIAKWAVANRDCMVRADELRYALRPISYDLATKYTELEAHLRSTLVEDQKRTKDGKHVEAPTQPSASARNKFEQERGEQLRSLVAEAARAQHSLEQVPAASSVDDTPEVPSRDASSITNPEPVAGHPLAGVAIQSPKSGEGLRSDDEQIVASGPIRDPKLRQKVDDLTGDQEAHAQDDAGRKGGEANIFTNPTYEPADAASDHPNELPSGTRGKVGEPGRNLVRRRGLPAFQQPIQAPETSPGKINEAGQNKNLGPTAGEPRRDEARVDADVSRTEDAVAVGARLASLLTKHAPPRPRDEPRPNSSESAPDAATLEKIGGQVRRTLDRIRYGQLRLEERSGCLVPPVAHSLPEPVEAIVRVHQAEARRAHELAKADFTNVLTFLQVHGGKVARRVEPISAEMMALLRLWRRDPRLRRTISNLRQEVVSAGRVRRNAQLRPSGQKRLAGEVAVAQSRDQQNGRW